MRVKYIKIFLIFCLFLLKVRIIAQDEILPIGQIRDIGAERSIQPELEEARKTMPEAQKKQERAKTIIRGGKVREIKAIGGQQEGKIKVAEKEIFTGKEKDFEKDVEKGKSVGGPAEFLPRMLQRKFDFSLQGYIALENMYDTRQVIGFKFNEFVFFPAPQNLDKSGLDINDKSQYNMMAARGTLTANLSGPEIWNAKPKALIEGDFTGINDATVGLFRLKKAFAQLDWNNSSVMLGQYTHPIVLDELYPEVISFGRGILYDPFTYAPQIKFRHWFDDYEFVLAISKRFDSAAARRAAIPDLFGQFNVYVRDHIFGAGINYHVEVPRLYSTVNSTAFKLNPLPEKENLSLGAENFKTNESISSIYPFVFAALKVDPFDIRMRFTYAQNGVVYSMIGGYDVVQRNPRTDGRLIESTATAAFWSDVIYKRLGRFEPAVFLGISKNLGTSKNILKKYQESPDEYSDDPNILTLLQIDNNTSGIDYTFICAPRLRVRFGNLQLCAELEYTRASFADPTTTKGWENDFGPTGKVVCGKPVNNIRALFATFYDFDYAPFTPEKDYFEKHQITK